MLIWYHHFFAFIIYVLHGLLILRFHLKMKVFMIQFQIIYHPQVIFVFSGVEMVFDMLHIPAEALSFDVGSSFNLG